MRTVLCPVNITQSSAGRYDRTSAACWPCTTFDQEVGQQLHGLDLQWTLQSMLKLLSQTAMQASSGIIQR